MHNNLVKANDECSSPKVVNLTAFDPVHESRTGMFKIYDAGDADEKSVGNI